MEIGYVGQYNKSATQTVGTPVPQASVTSLTASIKDLKPGSIFEGNVAYIKGSNVILSLENGQNIRARLDNHALKLVQGQSMFFQVKANEDGMVSIRPYMGGGSAANPTISRALDAAGLPVDAKNIDMVNAMMKEQMPIHADALLEMHRTILAGGNASVETLVQMAKLALPITPEMAAQFENYKNDTHMLLGQMNELMESLPEFLESQSAGVPQMVQMNAQLVEILTAGLPEEPPADAQQAGLQETGAAPETAAPEGAAAQGMPQTAAGGALEGMFLSELADDQAGEAKPAFSQNQLGAMLSPELREDFADVLRSTGNLAENEAVFDENGRLNPTLTARSLLQIINRELLAQQGGLEQDDVKDIFSHKGYQKLLSHVMEEQWLVQPQDLKTKDKLGELYERLNRQMEQIDKILKATGNEHTPLARGAEQVRGNMEFMNEVNQIYNYVQIPLKLSGQNANGDLYVYTNKKKPREKDGELSAFLHLDMEHLGSTDVFVKMKGRAVDTNFTFSDDESFALVQKFLPILDAKLAALGYTSTITVSSEQKKMDFVEDFLKKDLPGTSGGGVVHRYSFDVRA